MDSGGSESSASETEGKKAWVISEIKQFSCSDLDSDYTDSSTANHDILYSSPVKQVIVELHKDRNWSIGSIVHKYRKLGNLSTAERALYK